MIQGNMSEPFSEKLSLVLKALSMSRARLAADLGVHKSVVGRWVAGAVAPSAHNASRLSALIAQRVPGFTALDWDRSLGSLQTLLATELGGRPGTPGPGGRGGLPFPLLGQILARTSMHGAAYEGFYRSTRPYARMPGRYLHDHCMLRRDASGFLRLSMANAGVFVDGWVLLLHDQLFVVGAEFTSAALVFAILHGVDGPKAEVLDGLTLSPNLDPERTLTAAAIVLHRVGDLTGDPTADEARFAQLATGECEPAAESIPQALREHLARDIGPTPFALGGDLQLRLPRSRALSRSAPTP